MYIVLVLNTVRYLLLFLERTQSDVFFLSWTHSVRCFFLKQTVRDKDKDRHWDPDLNQQPDGGAVQVSFLLQLLLQLLWLQRFPGHLRGFWSKQYCRLFMCLSPLCVFVNQSDSTNIWRFTFLFPSDLVSPPPPHPPPCVILIEPSTPPMRDKIQKLGMDQRDPVVLRHKFRNWYIYQSAWQWQAKGLNRSAE